LKELSDKLRDLKTARQFIMITIRKAKQSDAETIIGFQQKMAWETEQMTLVPEIISKGVNGVFQDPSRGQYYVAESKEQIVASLLITYEWSDWRNANVWWFQSVYVLPDHRRNGIFRNMYSFIKNESSGNNVAGLRLYVESNNVRARKTYEALGMGSEHYTMYEWLRN
jgi:GNAT superfamily N-acetyltransferase